MPYITDPFGDNRFNLSTGEWEPVPSARFLPDWVRATGEWALCLSYLVLFGLTIYYATIAFMS